MSKFGIEDQGFSFERVEFFVNVTLKYFPVNGCLSRKWELSIFHVVCIRNHLFYSIPLFSVFFLFLFHLLKSFLPKKPEFFEAQE